MGRLAEYSRDINVSWEIQHETEQNLISTSSFCPTTFIPHVKTQNILGSLCHIGSVWAPRRAFKGLDDWSRQISLKFKDNYTNNLNTASIGTSKWIKSVFKILVKRIKPKQSGVKTATLDRKWCNLMNSNGANTSVSYCGISLGWSLTNCI